MNFDFCNWCKVHPAKWLYTLTAAHYFVLFSERVLIGMNMLNWMDTIFDVNVPIISMVCIYLLFLRPVFVDLYMFDPTEGKMKNINVSISIWFQLLRYKQW